MTYKKLTFADSPFTLQLKVDTMYDFGVTSSDFINANQNSLVLDVDLSGGNIIMNLPAISEFISPQSANTGASGGGAFSFYISGTIIGGANTLTVNAYDDRSDTDLICGGASAVISGDGTCFKIAMAGRHAWITLACGTLVQQPPPQDRQ